MAASKRPSPPLSGIHKDALPEFLSRAALRAARKWNAENVPKEPLTKTGSPGFKPSNAQAQAVARMTALGLKPHEIGDVLRISTSLLEFYYDYELRTAAHRVNVAVGKVALDMALSGADSDMTKFWLTSRGGPAWRPKSQVDVTGVNKDADDARAARDKLLKSPDVSETPGTDEEEQTRDS